MIAPSTRGKASNKSSRDPRAGQALVMVSLGVVFIMGILGLVVDVGWGYFRKQVAQAAADSAVLAAVTAAGTGTIICGSGGVACSAGGTSCSSVSAGTNLDAGCNYGYTNGVTKSNMTIASDLGSNTPISGIATSYWVKVTVEEPMPLSFLQVMGYRTGTVAASALAGITQGGTGGGCVYVLNTTATKAVWQTGSGDLESSCGVWVNSNDPKAIYQTAGAIINTGSAFTHLVGGYYQTGSSTITPLPVSATPVTDPLASRTLPTLPSPVVCSTNTGPAFTPGTYCGGISVTGTGGATFSPGLYIMDGGGFNIAGSGTVTGTGITVLLTSDASHTYKGVSINGSGTETFSAPTSGPNEAMLIIGSRSIASGVGSTVTGTSTTVFSGVIYVPQEALTYTGGSSLSSYTTVIADTLKMTGLTTIGSNYGSLSSGNPIGGAKTISLLQ